jgi:lipopolysaccharide/colanic/teichoic acid biosynthesis glycosyltransferase/glycosyltransferase involved in cell wall biosynthesis
MKILLLTQWFEPESTFKGLTFAKDLAVRGHEVQVLTGYPNYPGGKLYPGYRIRPWMRERMDGIDVLRVALYPSHDGSGLRRALNYLSFFLAAAVFGTALIRTPDVIYVYHPPITVGLAAIVIGFIRRAPFVYDIQDLWPDTVAVTGMLSSPRALAFLGRLCTFVYRRARHIVVLSPGFKEELLHRGIPSSKITLIYNWCDERALQNSGGPVSPLAGTGRFAILFAGTMGRAQGLESVLRAAQICQTAVPSAQFFFIGGGTERLRLERMATGLQLDNVEFLQRVPMQAMGRILASSDAAMVHLKDDPLFRITIPSKTQAYLAAGKPVLMAVLGDAADLVRRSRAGVLCEPDNPQSIADAVKELVGSGPECLAEMGNNGRAFYDCELSLARGVERFEGVFMAAVGQVWSMRSRQNGWRFVVKTSFDRLAALFGLVALFPILIVAGILVWLSTGRPILFRQKRPGRYAQPFILLKFRTMSEGRDATGSLLPDKDRLTRIGRLLRATSIDELPQLWNVLRGEMSLVGPRPLLMEYLPRYTPEQFRRHEVLPGITGWAQINGRNAIDWKEKFTLDVWYVDHWSLLIDFKILVQTLRSVIMRKDISSEKHATMPEFHGSGK